MPLALWHSVALTNTIDYLCFHSLFLCKYTLKKFTVEVKDITIAFDSSYSMQNTDIGPSRYVFAKDNTKDTTDNSVAYRFSRDQDNVKGLITTNSFITLPPLFLKVKALPQDMQQKVGNFSLDYDIKKRI